MIKIKNWTKFQHFKNRTPPWIKVYRDLLNDLDWFSLDDKSARCLIMLWLIASEDKNKNGELPDLQTIAFRLRMSEKDVNTCIKRLCKWVLHDDINMISTCQQHVPPETETETEKEREEEAEFSTLFSSLQSIESFERDWNEWMIIRKKKRASNSTYAKILILRELSKRKDDISDAMKMAIMKSWVGFEWKWFDGQKQSTSFTTQKPSTHFEQPNYLDLLKAKQEGSIK